MAGQIPTKFGKCLVEKRLGEGATALVFLARHEGLGIAVAVKVLRKHLSEGRPEYAERFLREARTAARLDHPNIVRVIDCGVEGGYHYMVMDYVDGRNCMEMLWDMKEGLPWREAAEIVRQSADGLAYAAERDIIHRDVKPSNIMIDSDGRVRVTDLGLAKLTVKGVPELTQELHTVGTPNYMSPEQIRAPSKLDSRADIYSLGATFYHLVTGRPPYLGENPMAVVSKHLTEPVVPPAEERQDLPEAVSDLICKMMAKLPDDRYQDYETLCYDLDNLRKGKSVTASGFHDSYTATEEDRNLVEVLERLASGRTFEVEEATAIGDQEQQPQQPAQEGSSSIPTFDRSDLSVFESPHEDRSTVLVQGDDQEGVWFLVLVLVIIGVLGVLGVALFAALSAR